LRRGEPREGERVIAYSVETDLFEQLVKAALGVWFDRRNGG
jgi:hypothetical protein